MAAEKTEEEAWFDATNTALQIIGKTWYHVLTPDELAFVRAYADEVTGGE